MAGKTNNWTSSLALRDQLRRLLTTDFCPGANRYLYWLKTPLGVLIASAVIALLCGIFVAPQGYVLAAAVVCVIALGIVWPWVAMRGVSCALSFPTKRSVEGTPTQVAVTVVNRWPFPVWGLGIEKGFFATDDGDATLVALAAIRGWSRSEFRWQFTPQQRGLYPFVAPELVTEFPFGLWKATRSIAIPDKMIVWPAHASLEQLPIPTGLTPSVSCLSDVAPGSEGDIIGTRPFRVGDSPRQVNWVQTARCDRLIVSERQGSAQSRVQLEVATDETLYASGDSEYLFEEVIRAAASIVQSLVEHSVIVQLIAGEKRADVDSRSSSLRRAMDLLATVEMSQPKGSATVLHNPHTFQIRVTTSADTAQYRFARRVVLDPSIRPARVPANLATPAWIDLNTSEPVLQQLPRKWRSAGQRRWRRYGAARAAG